MRMVVNEAVTTQMAKEVIDHGGEGIILRKPLSQYEHGRSNSLIKHKVNESG